MANYTKPTRGTGVEDHWVTVVTNLDSQKGNGLLSRTEPKLKHLRRPGDLLLSEMQVFPLLAIDRPKFR